MKLRHGEFAETGVMDLVNRIAGELTGIPASLGSTVAFQVTVPAHEAPGHADLEVIGPGGELAILPGALEITPPAPSVSLVLPNTGSSAGGASITIFGTDFRAGARVVIGDQIYVDGQAGGATVVGPTSIQLTTRAGLHGLHDVVVIDATGVEGRQVDGFLVSSQPVVDTIFPAAGDASGGTELVLRGGSFEGGLEVRIDGELQSAVTGDGATRAHVTTKGGLPGGPYSVQVQNPGGGIATSAFVYVGQADPVLAAVVPASGAASGGEELVLSGSNFTANSSVVFGADPDTGLGGAQASVVEFVDASTLRVTTPPHASGAVSVMVRDDSTEQASLLPQSFSFSGAAQGSGGGGCHAGLASGGPTRLVDVVGGSWWILLALGALQLDTLRRRRQLARV